MVSVVLDSAQLLIGSSGLDGWPIVSGGPPLEWSMCAHAVASGRPYVVEDAALDDQQRVDPLVTVDGVRSYAGVPLITQQPRGRVRLLATGTPRITVALPR